LFKILIRFGYAAAVLASMYAVSISAIWLMDVHTERRAESLLRDVSALQVGTSTMRQVEPILRNYSRAKIAGSWPCRSADRFYSVQVANDAVSWIRRGFPAVQSPLVRPYGAVAVILLSRGVVCYVKYYAGTALRGPDQELDVSTTVAASADAPQLLGTEYRVSAGIRQGRFHTIEVYIAPGTRGGPRQHAFDYDLSCLARWNGCAAPCELMPSAWLDYQKEARTNNWILPAEDADDPRCAKLVGK
jgi:hypothetical protein